jgi:DNA-directed RNA polymerase subunit beta'
MPIEQTNATRVNERAAVRIALASPQDVLDWSSGEVTSGETLNYRSGRPVPGGLFCERIFGPARDWECACGRYRGVKHKGAECERCGVRVAHSRGRRQRLGHIELAAPVVHVWFFKLRPSILGHLLGLKGADVERVVYRQAYLVLGPGDAPLRRGDVLDEGAYRQARERHGPAFEAESGAEALERALRDLDLPALARALRAELARLAGHARAAAERQRKLAQRLRTVEALLRSGNRPEGLVLRRVPVVPPDLRPVVRLESGNYASSDLNDLYRRILQRNARLRKLLELNAPEVILRNEKRLLQQAVDALFDNARSQRPVVGASRRPLKSLSDLIKGKQGRFRQNLLGKRVDYSARSVIVVGPELKLHQCGLPKVIALELFQPFVVGRLIRAGAAATVHKARRLLQAKGDAGWDALAEAMRGHLVLLNRAPTLHRMGIQAFEPVLVEGHAIRLHPLVCKAFNADFDGDQMAVHLPLSVQALAEARERLTPASNVFSPANGQPILAPSKDIVLGCYYLTLAGDEGAEARWTASPGEVVLAHALGEVGTHDRVRLRLPPGREVVREEGTVGDARRLVPTTVGRVLFDDALPAGMPFYDLALTARNLSRVIADCQQRLGRAPTVGLLERVKELGFRAATRSGLSFATADLGAPAGKEQVLAETERAVAKVEARFQGGDLTEAERKHQVIELWARATGAVRGRLMQELAAHRRAGGPPNPIHVMVQSGARGSAEQFGQLAGMRGLMARPSGEVLETPIRSSFREGLSVLEYFSSTHGARKGLVDVALKTADSGYLTRKLVDAAQAVLVTTHDCGTTRGVRKTAVGRPLADAVLGRVSVAAIDHPVSGAPLVGAGAMIGARAAAALGRLGLEEVWVRSPLTCEARRGVCRLCYGMDRATGRLVELGTAVGVLAAQSIGEPATQLTLRTFHTGGVASAPDITTGLPRVLELFEAQRPARPAVLAEVSGVVRVGEPHECRRRRRRVFVRSAHGEVAHAVPAWARLVVRTGDRVEAGQPLSDGPPTPSDLLRTAGLEAAGDWLVHEIQATYRRQGIDLDDKHVEVVVARMLSSVKVRDAGDSELLPGAVIDRKALREANEGLERPATAAPLLLGVSRAALQAEGFLSAASFQETTRVLAEAALAGKVDELTGLKENVLLGQLVPAGTGFRPDGGPFM